MGQKKKHSNLIEDVLKKSSITQTWFAKELVMSFNIANVCNREQQNLASIFKVADLFCISSKELIK